MAVDVGAALVNCPEMGFIHLNAERVNKDASTPQNVVASGLAKGQHPVLRIGL